MHLHNANSLESLSWFCHVCGVFSVFIGMTIIFFNLADRDFLHIQSGIYIFATGYTLVKIAKKIMNVINSERILG